MQHRKNSINAKHHHSLNNSAFNQNLTNCFAGIKMNGSVSIKNVNTIISTFMHLIMFTRINTYLLLFSIATSSLFKQVNHGTPAHMHSALFCSMQKQAGRKVVYNLYDQPGCHKPILIIAACYFRWLPVVSGSLPGW